jgi:hypothetical protein
MTNVSIYSFIMYLCGYLFIMIIGFIIGILVYYNCSNDKTEKKEPLIKHSTNDEILKVIKTMKKDLITNKDKYSFIEINDIINIIIDIYIKNKFEFNNDEDCELVITTELY